MYKQQNNKNNILQYVELTALLFFKLCFQKVDW